MDNIRIAVLDAYDVKITFMDNSLPEALHYYKDELHTYLEGSAAAFTFMASAKHGDSQYLAEGNKLSFRYRGNDYYFNIVKVYRTEYIVEITAYALMFELLNEDAPEYKAGKAMSFKEYMNVFDPEGTVKIGINEVSDKKIKNEWTGTSTVLARIFSLANVFGAEAEFVPELNKDYSLKKLTLNVYRENGGEYQGIGQKRNDITLRYGVNVKGIKKTSDIEELYTAIYPTGKDGLTIAGLNKKELDADGNVLFFSPSGDGCIRAVQARDRFPSSMLGKDSNDRYVIKRWAYETDSAEMLYGQALAELKKLCEPQVTYEVDGYFDTDIGDTVMIVDGEYNPILYLEARVAEQVRSFTDPTRNKTTFDNFTELEPQVDAGLLEKMNALIKENKVYTCTITTDYGIVFKNGEGTTSLTANVRDAGADVTDTLDIQWKKDDVALAVGKTIIVNAGDIQGKAVYSFEALEGEIIRGFCEVTVSNVSDGAPGEPGGNGVGIDSVINKYAVSSSSVTAPEEWSDSAPAMTVDNKYLWNHEITTYTDGTRSETQKCVIGVYGDTGADGKGIRALAKYYLASAAASGVTASTPGWTAAMQATTASKRYLWSYEVTTYTDGTTSVSLPVVIGTHGETGEKGADGQMLYAASDTAESTADKAAALVDGALALKAGTTVAVRFTYANTAAAPTLNVNNTGAKAVYTQGVRYAYWSAGATVIFTYDGSYWRVASEPVYADTATIGNPGNSNIFLDGASIKFRKGNIIFASLSYSSNIEGSTGASLAADSVEIKGDPVVIGKQNGSVIVNCQYPQTGQAGFRVFATGSTAEFNADDLVLRTGEKDISLLGLSDRTILSPNLAFATSAKTYKLSAVDDRKLITVYIACGTSQFDRVITMRTSMTSGFYIYQNASYNLTGYVSISSAGVLTYQITSIVGWTASAFKLSRIVISD